MEEEEIVYWWETALERFLYILFPPYCVICGKRLPFGGKEEKRLCAHCRANTPYLGEDVCEVCGKPSVSGGLCEQCLLHSPVFEKAAAAFIYDDVRDGIARFKYRGGKIDGDTFGQLMVEYLQLYHKDWLREIDVVTPVPLHPKKERRRGFNQSGVLCEWISEICEIPYEEDVLQRIKNTKPQSKLHGDKRTQNIHGVFTAKDCAGKSVLLVDDIFTTGATANECSRVLYRNGAKKVFVYCLSHTK